MEGGTTSGNTCGNRRRPAERIGDGRRRRRRRDKARAQDDGDHPYLATVVGVLIASAVDDSLDGRGAWQLVTALTIGYLLSRGLAKSGSKHREDRDTI